MTVATGTRPRIQAWPGITGGILPADPHAHEDLAGYRRDGGYPDPDPVDLMELLTFSGLRGRGGAGFPVARKLAALRDAAGPKVAVANGEEGEPGSIKDRYLLRHRPHLVLDGLRLMARAAGADRRIVYVSDPETERAVRLAVAEGAGPHDHPVEVFRVPHAYVAGEETALVRALNGGPALPTAKPPRPFESGVGGLPTLVQNVETLAHVALLARDPGRTPTFLATVAGAGGAGLYELPFGVTMAELARWHGAEPDDLLGALVGGLFGGLLADPWGIPLGHESLAARGSGLGCGAFGLLGPESCPVDAAADALAHLATASSQQCGVCINATAGMRDVLGRLRAGDAIAADVAKVDGWAQMVPGRGACALVDAAARMVASLLREFPAEVAAHLERPCDACVLLGELPSETRHFVAPTSPTHDEETRP